jgi:hypothetical protein
VLLTALAAACGVGAGASVGEVSLTVTRDYGSELILQRRRDVPESETAMRLLDRYADVSTRYGGGFVHSVNGVAGRSGGESSYDWFFYVNGVESGVGAADYPLQGGDRVWWDYRDWGAAMRVPAVVGSYPEPFLHGYEGERRRVVVRCRGATSACRMVRRRLPAGAAAGSGDPIRVLVGAWSRLRPDPAAALIERGPDHSGVFADFVRSGATWKLQPLDEGGSAAGRPRSAALVAATRLREDPPTWLVTGSAASQVTAAARLLGPAELRNRYALATASGRSIALPVP